ncbi:unnamed protein product [Paramecium sonneborni]|uniref:Uncharacterized protein n=1 Tax=Paramecium sonneborni TaxID=65129 RepID=A0A8S1RJY7_9CILI|nr:unnamed protein product [Paramecium sonneborni]
MFSISLIQIQFTSFNYSLIDQQNNLQYYLRKGFERCFFVEFSKNQFYFTECHIASILKEAPFNSNRNIFVQGIIKIFNYLCIDLLKILFMCLRMQFLNINRILHQKYYFWKKLRFQRRSIFQFFDLKAIEDLNQNLQDLELQSTNTNYIIVDDVVQKKKANFQKHINTIILEFQRIFQYQLQKRFKYKHLFKWLQFLGLNFTSILFDFYKKKQFQ